MVVLAAFQMVLLAATEVPPEALAVTVGLYEQEVSAAYAVPEGLPAEDVWCVAPDKDGVLRAGTSKGLARLNGERWEEVPELRGTPISRFVDDLRPGRLWVVSGSSLCQLEKGKLTKVAPVPVGAVNDATVARGCLMLATDVGLFCLTMDGFSPDASLNDQLLEKKEIYSIAPTGTIGMAAGGSAGLYVSEQPGIWHPLYPSDARRSWALRDVRVVAYDKDARLWFACAQGVGNFDGKKWTLYDASDGLPYNDFTAMAAGPDGTMWFGTHLGAIRFDGTSWAYRQGKSWLPSDDVRSLTVLPDGSAWFATPAGVGVIRRRTMTLTEKAQFFETEIDKRHRRTQFQYVQSVRLERPGDLSAWIQRDDDNDGQYTGMYGAAECFAYAATKDPRAKARATTAFEALRFLSRVTQGGEHPAPKGFPARSILPTSGPNPNDWPEYSIETDKKRRIGDALWKVIHPRWPTSADGKWYWKCDTSSDELDGHYYLYGLYFDLVAETEAEKEPVREVVRDLTDHLVEHEFRLVDWDGQPTRWANFNPDSLNRDPNWWPERGLNSLSMLTYLRIAEHVTGDAKYGEIFNRLAWQEGYATNAMYPKVQRGPGSYVQFDDEMACLNYYNLLRLEKDPKLRQMFAASCYGYWELEACERNSFFNFTYAAACQGLTFETPWGTMDLSPQKACIEDAVDTLKRYPLNLVDWRHTNSHRTDIVPLPAYVREPGEAEGCGLRVDGTVVPIDERHFHVWADDPWQLDNGGDGGAVEDGAAFLLAYYMGLYHGFIVGP